MKNILITGANRGIGYEIARQLGSLGHTILLTSRDRTKGTDAVERLRLLGIKSNFYILDVSDHESIEGFVRELTKTKQRVDVLINNAGILLDQSATLESVTIGSFERTMKTNFYGPFLLIRTLIPILKTQSDARIINFSSSLGALNSMEGSYGSYRISKTAINALTAIFAAELKPYGISVNSMDPGWVQTEMGGKNAPRTVEKGAETAVWLATEKEIPNGKFIRDKKVIPW